MKRDGGARREHDCAGARTKLDSLYLENLLSGLLYWEGREQEGLLLKSGLFACSDHSS